MSIAFCIGLRRAFLEPSLPAPSGPDPSRHHGLRQVERLQLRQGEKVCEGRASRAEGRRRCEAAHADDQDGEEPPLAQPARKRITNYALNVGTSSLREALQQLQAGIVARLSLDRPECRRLIRLRRLQCGGRAWRVRCLVQHACSALPRVAYRCRPVCVCGSGAWLVRSGRARPRGLRV